MSSVLAHAIALEWVLQQKTHITLRALQHQMRIEENTARAWLQAYTDAGITEVVVVGGKGRGCATKWRSKYRPLEVTPEFPVLSSTGPPSARTQRYEQVHQLNKSRK